MKAERIEVKAATEEYGLFFYVGINPFPGKDAVKHSLANDRGYKPNRLHGNKDGSITVEFQNSSFGFNDRERFKEFSAYFNELVVPRLIERVDVPVDANPAVAPVRLQNTILEQTSDPNRLKPRYELVLGTMSLFATELDTAGVVAPERTAA